jgi:hypothetical protein
MMKSRTIHVGTRRAERGAEQEDEEDGRGWKAISSHGVPAVLISDKKAICGPDFSFHSGSYCRLFYFSFQ